MSKQYSVRQWVGHGKADKAAVQEILDKHPFWKEKHAREQLAMRRFAESIRNAGKKAT